MFLSLLHQNGLFQLVVKTNASSSGNTNMMESRPFSNPMLLEIKKTKSMMMVKKLRTMKENLRKKKRLKVMKLLL